MSSLLTIVSKKKKKKEGNEKKIVSLFVYNRVLDHEKLCSFFMLLHFYTYISLTWEESEQMFDWIWLYKRTKTEIRFLFVCIMITTTVGINAVLRLKNIGILPVYLSVNDLLQCSSNNKYCAGVNIWDFFLKSKYKERNPDYLLSLSLIFLLLFIAK